MVILKLIVTVIDSCTSKVGRQTCNSLTLKVPNTINCMPFPIKASMQQHMLIKV